MERSRRSPLFLAAALAVAAALAATLHTALSAPRKLAALARREAELGDLRRLTAQWAAEEAYLARLDAEGRTEPVDPGESAGQAFGGRGSAEVTPGAAQPAADGWEAREARVACRDILYGDLSVFLDGVTGTQPPWRVREISLEAGAKPGRGAATVALEALARAADGKNVSTDKNIPR